MKTRTLKLATRALQGLETSSIPRLLAARQPYIYQKSYHSETSPDPEPFSATESTILSSALHQVPHHGFTETALVAGAREAGYLDVSTNLFPRGVFDLIMYHLSTQRLALKNSVQFPSTAQLGIGSKVRSLTLQRLRANAPVITHWQQALAIMAQPSYVPASLHELSLLADEIWFLAGDTAVDMSYYSKRASLAGVYAAAEVFMTTDRSEGFAETERFLDRRLQEVRSVGGSLGAVGEWMGVSGRAALNVLRSKGVRV